MSAFSKKICFNLFKRYNFHIQSNKITNTQTHFWEFNIIIFELYLKSKGTQDFNWQQSNCLKMHTKHTEI